MTKLSINHDKKELPESNENIDHPSYYGGDTTYEVIKVVEAWGYDTNLYRATTIIYLARAGKKPGADELQDLKKAAWYLDREIKRLEDGSKG